MDKTEASIQEWRRLFEAAIKFKQQGCWNWMTNEDYFAITDPETGEIGYCVPLGAGGMDYGLNVYRGPQAGAFLRDIVQSYGVDKDTKESMFTTDAISVNFEDRDQLDKKDLGLIRELGYKFRGSGEWPLFRSYKPGLQPWYLDKQEVRFLTVALEQAFVVAERFRENHELNFERDETEYGSGEKRLHLVPQATKNGIVWQDHWLPWHPKGELIEPYLYPDEIRLRQLKKTVRKSKEIWEADFMFADILIGKRGERGQYPRLCLWVNGTSGIILGAEIVENIDCRQQFVDQLLHLLESTKLKPSRIHAASDKAFLALKDTAEKLGIPIVYNPMSLALLHAQEAIQSSF